MIVDDTMSYPSNQINKENMWMERHHNLEEKEIDCRRNHLQSDVGLSYSNIIAFFNLT
jgi:hypothetical protein